MACLADTCPIFGCRSHLPRPKSYAYESGRGSRHNSAIRLAKNVFNICTQTDIHRARLQCEVLTERYMMILTAFMFISMDMHSHLHLHVQML